MQKISLTELRNNIYQLSDHIIITGEPLLIERNGKRLVLCLDNLSKPKLSRLKAHKTINGNPDELVNIKLWNENQIQSF